MSFSDTISWFISTTALISTTFQTSGKSDNTLLSAGRCKQCASIDLLGHNLAASLMFFLMGNIWDLRK